MIAKERHRITLIDYMSDPNNKPLTRAQQSIELLGFKTAGQINRTFTPIELQEIERQALDLRRTKYSVRLSEVDDACLKAAQEGNPVAMKLAYQRFEGWFEKKGLEHTGKDGGPIEGVRVTFRMPDGTICDDKPEGGPE